MASQVSSQMSSQILNNRRVADAEQGIGNAHQEGVHFMNVERYGTVEQLEAIKNSYLENINLARTNYGSITDSALKESSSKLMTECDKMNSFFQKHMDASIAALKSD